MKNSKKLLALLTALSISTSAFAGLAPVAGAATEEDILWSDTFNNAAPGVFLDGTLTGSLTNSEAINGLTFVTSNRGSGDRGCYTDAAGNYVLGGSYYAVNEKEDASDKYVRLSFPVFGDFLGDGGRWAHVDFKEAYTATETTDIVMDFDLKLTNGMVHGVEGVSPILRIGTFDAAAKTASAVEIDKATLGLGDDWVHARIITTAAGSKLYINQEEITSVTSTATSLAQIGLYSADGMTNGAATYDLLSGYTPADGGSYADADKPTYTPIADLDNVIIYTEAAGVATGTSAAPGAQDQEGGATPKPTATPKVLPAAPSITAPEGVTGLEEYNFDSNDTQKWSLTTEEKTITDIPGLSVHIGGRADGGNVDTYAAVAALKTGKGFEMQAAGFSTAGRAPRVSVDTSMPVGDGVSTAMSFNVYLSAAQNHETEAYPRLYLLKDTTQAGTDGAGAYRNVAAVLTAVQDEVIYRGDDTASDVISTYVTPDEWHTVTFVVTPGEGVNTHRVFIDGAEEPAIKVDYVATGENASSMDNLPILTVESSSGDAVASFGNITIDNLLAYQGAVEEPRNLVPTIEAAPTPEPTPEPTPTPEIIADVEMTFDVDTNKVSMTSDVEAPAYLIQASYDATGKFVAVKTVKEVSLKAGTAVTETLDSVAGGDKIMLWGNLSSIRPFADVVVAPEKTPEPTPSPTPTPTPKPTKTPVPENAYYVLDFEDTSKTYINSAEGTTTTPELWASQYYFAGLSIATDTNTDINKHMKYLNNQGKGTRTSYYILPEEAGTLVEEQSVIEFDFRFRNGGTNGNNQIVLIGNSTTPIGNGDYEPGNKPAGTAAILKFTQPKDGNGQFIINNSGTTLDDATAKSAGYVNDTWAHVKAVMNFNTHTVILTVTSLDGSTTYFETSQVTMDAPATKLSQLFVAAARDASYVCVDNVVVRPLGDHDITDTYYTATFDVDGTTSVMSAKEGETLIELPDVEKTGYIFDGWYKDDDTTTVISSETVLATPLTAAVKYTAVYHKDPDYIEPLASLSFTAFPTNGLPTMGADADTYADNIITVSLTGEIGTDLIANPDSRVTDLDVEWEFNGFRHIVSKAAAGENAATTDEADSNEYCDSYAKVIEDEANPTSVNFQLKNMPFNFYGQVKATVTYNGQTMEIVKPMAIVPNTASESGVLLPKPGYVSNFNWYSDDMVGYAATISADNKSATDIVTGDWAAYGGNAGRGLYLVEEEGNKFLQLNSTGTNSSSFAVNKLDSAPTGQVIISQDIRFHNANSSILFKSLNPVNWNTGATTLSLNFTGTEFNLNGGEAITAATTGVWYKVVLSADVTSKLCYAKIYDEDGKLLGESDVMPFSDAASLTPVYLCYRTPDNSQGKLDFNNVLMYTPEIAGELSTTIENETLSVPENAGDAAATTTLTVSAVSTEGYDMIGAAEWSIVDEPENVTITPATDNSHTATLSVANGAQPGEITVRVALGGKTKDIVVTLSSSQDSVSFTKSTKSISIPMDASASADYVYEAAVVDKDGNPIAGKTVTYAIYDKNNVNELTTLPTGVSFNKETGTLTVTGEASATTVYVRATGTNTADEVISRAVKVTIHGLAFDFGTDADGAVVEGYTAVTAGTVYSDTAGYGIEGTASAGGTADLENADADNLTGAFTFKVKVEAGKVYNVTINYFGNVASEYVNSDLSGVALANTASTTPTTVTYVVPVVDDILDLAFTNGSIVSSIVIEKQADKLAGAKPHIFTVGDSTSSNNGSWAYVFARDYVTKAPEVAEIATFSSNGRGGKNLGSYYTGGELRDRVLSQIKPGDYVIIGNMGTNGMGADFEGSFNYYIDACEAMGAKVILASYSPHGPLGGYESGYDATTQTFEMYRKDAYDNTVRAIYAERSDATNENYDANVVGFIDIGKMADAAYNAYVDNYEAEGYESREAAAQAIVKCFTDHNHYSGLASDLMNWGYGDGEDAKGIAKRIVEILTADLAK